MPRIPLFPTADMTAAQSAVHDKIVNGPRGVLRGPLRAVLHRAELADKWQQLGELLRYRTSLPSRLSELAILVTARHWDAQFEWYAHEPIALAAGVPERVVARIRSGEAPAFEHADEEIVYRYVAELLERHVVNTDLYNLALQLLQVIGIVELTALVGYYSMVALTLNAHEIPLPAGVAAPLPERMAPPADRCA